MGACFAHTRNCRKASVARTVSTRRWSHRSSLGPWLCRTWLNSMWDEKLLVGRRGGERSDVVWITFSNAHCHCYFEKSLGMGERWSRVAIRRSVNETFLIFGQKMAVVLAREVVLGVMRYEWVLDILWRQNQQELLGRLREVKNDNFYGPFNFVSHTWF